jgi:long-subunit fatty acid transport protein
LLPTVKWVNYAGYIWHRDYLEANFLRTSHRRYENWGFLSAEPSRYLTDAHTAFIGTSYQFTPKLTGMVDYSITAILGERGSGEVGTVLGPDNDLDNVTQFVSAGLGYAVSARWSVGVRYAYAVYHDNVYRALDSDYHTVGVSASVRF